MLYEESLIEKSEEDICFSRIRGPIHIEDMVGDRDGLKTADVDTTLQIRKLTSKSFVQDISIHLK